MVHCIRGSVQRNLAYTEVETHPREQKKREREICTISMCLLREHLGRNHTIAEVEHVDHPPQASREGGENLEVLLRFVPPILNPFHSHRPPAIESYTTSDAVIISASYLLAEVSKFETFKDREEREEPDRTSAQERNKKQLRPKSSLHITKSRNQHVKRDPPPRRRGEQSAEDDMENYDERTDRCHNNSSSHFAGPGKGHRNSPQETNRDKKRRRKIMRRAKSSSSSLPLSFARLQGKQKPSMQ
jgi:hypothetical protein